MATPPILSTAISGLEAASRRANVAANNIVNADSRGFQPSRVDDASRVTGTGRVAAGSGVEAQIRASDASGVSVGFEFTELIRAEVAFRAAAELVRTADDIARETVDIVG